MNFATKATPQALESIADAKRSVFWLDRPERPEAEPSLEADISTDLVVIGGGFTGLWADLVVEIEISSHIAHGFKVLVLGNFYNPAKRSNNFKIKKLVFLRLEIERVVGKLH